MGRTRYEVLLATEAAHRAEYERIQPLYVHAFALHAQGVLSIAQAERAAHLGGALNRLREAIEWLGDRLG